MEPNSCCFTGHRILPTSERILLPARLREEISELIGKGVTRFYAGGALGFDTLAARAVLAMREPFPQISLHLILPCRTQADHWTERDKTEYFRILEEADEVTYISDHYTDSCMALRNRALVDHSDVCLCYLSRSSGGTAATVQYAERRRLLVINLALPRQLSF